MKLLTSIILLFFFNSIFGQVIEEKIPKIYYSDFDSIKYYYSIYPETFNLVLKANDTISPGTDNCKGIILTAFIGNDTLKIIDNNYPCSKRTIVTIQTPKGKSVVIFRYNSVAASFSQEYMHENEGKINFEIPEVFELANIIWTLSPSGKRAKDLYKNSEYYNEVVTYFKPYLNHPIFKELDFDEDNYFDNYYEFRENSFVYKFDKDKIISGGSYNYVIGNDWDSFNSLFKDLIPLVEDFAKKSDFRKFYKSNREFYSNEIERLNALLPVKDIWIWLETKIPDRKFNSYKIVTSPLIGGSHSTQTYYTYNTKTNNWYAEAVMFICTSDRYNNKRLNNKQKIGLMSGIVFTEIDHNYINKASYKYKETIDSIFSKENYWVSSKSNYYINPLSVFNEYMTHALFCLWVTDYFDIKTANFIIKAREDLNVEARKFTKFKEFNRELIKLYKINPDKLITEIFPLIIDWCKKQI